MGTRGWKGDTNLRSGEDRSLQDCLAWKGTAEEGMAGCNPDCPKGSKKPHLSAPSAGEPGSLG